MSKKINSQKLTRLFVSQEKRESASCEPISFNGDWFTWDDQAGCWRARLTDAQLAEIVKNETGLRCSAAQIQYWRQKMVIAPVRKGGARPGAGRPRKQADNQNIIKMPDDYDRVLFLHKQDVAYLSKFGAPGNGVVDRKDSYKSDESEITPLIEYMLSGGGKKGRQGGRSDRRMAAAVMK